MAKKRTDKEDIRFIITEDSFSITNNSDKEISLIKVDYSGQFDGLCGIGYVPLIRKKDLLITFTNRVDSDTIFTYEGDVVFKNFRIYHTFDALKKTPFRVEYQEDKWEKERANWDVNKTPVKWEDADARLFAGNQNKISSVTFQDFIAESEIKMTSEFTTYLKKAVSREQIKQSIGKNLASKYPVDFNERSREYIKTNKKYKNLRTGDK